MKVLVAIPTRSRAQLLSRCANFHSELMAEGLDLLFFVEPHQYKDYSKFVHTKYLHVMPEDNNGLMYACQQIYLHSIGRYDVVFKLDDDVRGFAGRTKLSRMRNLTRLVLQDCLPVFASHSHLGAVSFPYSHQLFSLKRWPSMNSRLQTAYLIRPEWFLSELPGALGLWEDFVHTVMLRNIGGYTLRYGHAGIVCEEVGKGSGGQQDFNRLGEYKEARDQFKLLVPDLQWRIVTKPWKLEPDFARTPSLRGHTLDTDELPSDQELLSRLESRAA